MFRETDVRNFTNVPAHSLKIHSKTWIPFFWITKFQYFIHLQFKFTFLRKIQVNIKNLKNIPKSHRKIPNWNMCFKVLYKCHRKNLKTKIKKIKILCRASELALGKGTSLPSARPDTRQRMTEGPPASPKVFCRGLFFAECLTLGKEDVWRVSLFAECLALGKDGLCWVRHSANCLFAECPCFDTRQRACLP